MKYCNSFRKYCNNLICNSFLINNLSLNKYINVNLTYIAHFSTCRLNVLTTKVENSAGLQHIKSIKSTKQNLTKKDWILWRKGQKNIFSLYFLLVFFSLLLHLCFCFGLRYSLYTLKLQYNLNFFLNYLHSKLFFKNILVYSNEKVHFIICLQHLTNMWIRLPD